MRGQGKAKAQFLWTAVFLALVGVLLVDCLPGEDRREIDLDDRASDAELRELTARTDTDVLRFGFDLRVSPQEDARQYLPFLEYLTKATGYAFELRFTPQDGQIVDDLGTGVVHLRLWGRVQPFRLTPSTASSRLCAGSMPRAGRNTGR